MQHDPLANIQYTTNDTLDDALDRFYVLQIAVESILFSVASSANFGHAIKSLNKSLRKLRKAYNENKDPRIEDKLKFEITAWWVARHSLYEESFMSALTLEKADQLSYYQERFRL